MWPWASHVEAFRSPSPRQTPFIKPHRNVSNIIQLSCSMKSHHLPINNGAQLKSDAGNGGILITILQEPSPPPLFLFLWKHPSLSTKWVRQKYSIKTSGLNSSFIILGLICNCRSVFCHFEAQNWELQNCSCSPSSSRRWWRSAALIYQILMKTPPRKLSLVFWQRFDSASMPVDCHLELAQCKKRLLFCVNVVSNKSAEWKQTCDLLPTVPFHAENSWLRICGPARGYRTGRFSTLIAFSLMEGAVKKRWKSHWVASGGGAVGETLAERMKVKHWPALLSRSRSQLVALGQAPILLARLVVLTCMDSSQINPKVCVGVLSI